MSDYIDIDRIKREVENMSTESGKTCVECKPIVSRVFAPVVAREKFIGVKLCPLHDGSMAEKLAEALREARKYIHINSQYWEHLGSESAMLLRTYDELQGPTCSECHRPRNWHSEESGHMMDHPYSELQGRKG